MRKLLTGFVASCLFAVSAASIASPAFRSSVVKMLMAATPYMGLTVPPVGTSGPLYATQINADLTTIDGHNHTPGAGACIPSQATCIATTLPMNGQTLSDAGAVVFLNNASPIPATFAEEVYGAGDAGDLWYNDNAGHQIQLTANGAPVGSGGGTGTSGAGPFVLPSYFQASSVTKASIDTSGDLSLNGSVSAAGGASITGLTTSTTLTTTGQAILNSLAVQGITQLDGGILCPVYIRAGSNVFSVDCSGNVLVSGTMGITGNLSETGSLTVTGPTSVSSLQTSGTATIDNMTVKGTAGFDGGVACAFNVVNGSTIEFSASCAGAIVAAGGGSFGGSINMNNNQIHHMAGGSVGDDAVTLGQLLDGGGAFVGSTNSCTFYVLYPDAGPPGGGALFYADCIGDANVPNVLYVDGGARITHGLFVSGGETVVGGETVDTITASGTITANGNPSVLGANILVPDAVTASVYGRVSNYPGVNHTLVVTENMKYDAGGVWCEDDNTEQGLLSYADSNTGFYWQSMAAGACTASPTTDMAIIPSTDIFLEIPTIAASTLQVQGEIVANGNPALIGNNILIPDAVESGVYGRNGSSVYTGVGGTYQQTENMFYDAGGNVTCADNPAFVGLIFTERNTSQVNYDAGFYWGILPPGGCSSSVPTVATLLTTGDFSTTRSVTSPQITATTAATMASESVTGLAIDDVLQVDGGESIRLGNLTFMGSNNQIQWDGGAVYIDYPGPNTPSLNMRGNNVGVVMADQTGTAFDGLYAIPGVGAVMTDPSGNATFTVADGGLKASVPIISPAAFNPNQAMILSESSTVISAPHLDSTNLFVVPWHLGSNPNTSSGHLQSFDFVAIQTGSGTASSNIVLEVYDATASTVICSSTVITNGSSCAISTGVVSGQLCFDALTNGDYVYMATNKGVCTGTNPIWGGSFTVTYP